MYYDGNELYRYLVEQKLTDRFFWVSADMWTLLYANSNCEPAFLCFVSKVNEKEELSKSATPEEAVAFRRFCVLAEQAQLPLISLRFVEDGFHNCEQFRFKVFQSGEPPCTITPNQLLLWMQQHGLQFQRGAAAKKINKNPSSSFHLWQRKNLGNITAIDIDLLHFDDSRVDTIYELKRSKVPLNKWDPTMFEIDRSDYCAELMLAQRAGADFKTIYNVRHLEPAFFDDISRLKIYDMNQGWPGKCLGQFAVEDYFK